MPKPREIPQDIWDAATKAWNDVYLNLISEDQATEVIARAVFAERDRAKRLAHRAGRAHGETAAGTACMQLALDIIEGKAA